MHFEGEINRNIRRIVCNVEITLCLNRECVEISRQQ
jgi:hypothetical protein